MQTGKRPDRKLRASTLFRLSDGVELVLGDAETVLLIVQGSCRIRSSEGTSARLEAGALLLGPGTTQRALDQRIARALRAMHAAPERPWTVAQLARAAGLSRAAFARRFTLLNGQTPARYLTELRLALAQRLLTTSHDSLAELAERVGYQSEFSFNRAFKRRYGVAPGLFRRLHQSAIIGNVPTRAAA